MCSSAAFLIHNWPPARIFMGDVGSAFLGYTLAILPLIYGYSNSDPRALFIGFLVVWPFVFDAGFTLIRRALRQENVFAAHRSHLYQRMSTPKSGHTRVALLYSGLALAGCLLATAWTGQIKGSEFAILITVSLLSIGLWGLTIILSGSE
jgi:UDP-N-acetylmuramyl pentapeptide phosphotransferase/UDP-N-acetylglucosamine-1-phosphate transferase